MSNLNIPEKLKGLTSYIKTANELERRDPVISYYCRLYAVQKGMELDRSSKESKMYLMSLMDTLDKTKTELRDNDSIISETVGQAHVEEYALKLFAFADKKDREGDFGQPTIRSFVTAGFLMDVLAVFGDVGDDIEKCRKYAKWKAVYINQCVKNGQTPHSGPLDEGEELPSTDNLPVTNPSSSVGLRFVEPPKSNTAQPLPRPRNTPPVEHNVSRGMSNVSHDTGNGNIDVVGTNLNSEDFAQAEKFCKFALSALQYQDTSTAVGYLRKCLDLLTAGKR